MNATLKAEEYKLKLANDLIVYLGSVLTYNMTQAQAAQFLGQAMETWSQRVDHQLSNANKKNVEEHIKQLPDESPDVVAILVDIHTKMPAILRDEFVEQTFELLQNTVVASKEE